MAPRGRSDREYYSKPPFPVCAGDGLVRGAGDLVGQCPACYGRGLTPVATAAERPAAGDDLTP